ncbi:rab GTPase-binding effector protein 1 isoform X3 [Cydia pomonella]|uniref:rab GTPase-binding effector protein 1 isoform X3 n=1 Tax=Cydia pomonella TaxID=82600 RepID=UPI002ADD6902|nr:rab GTPase-binding effector protein 1 isoform X3 [Cydia pomonella]
MSDDTNEVSKVESSGGAEEARRGLEEEFNVQRARMKELFLQKEEELRAQQQDREQLQSEVLSLREELAQLQTLAENQKSHILNLDLIVNETVSASSAVTEEARQLRVRCAELEHQLRLQQQQQHQQPTEDGDLQRCEMEISQLKNKLRDTDAQLQEALRSRTNHPTPAHASGDTRTDPDGGRACDMCANYEKQLVHEQREAAAARDRAAMLEHALKLATEELEGARSIHDETIRSWHSERSSGAALLEQLRAAVEAAHSALEARAAAAGQASERALEQVTNLTVEREELQRKLDSLERDNAMLVGRFTKKAEEMQNEFIDLPDSVDELQLYSLELREKLICVQIGREEALAAERDLRAQLLEQSQQFHRQEAELQEARTALRHTREELDRLATEREQLQELGGKLRTSTDQIAALLDDKKRLLDERTELKGRVAALQQELDNSEKVQQDFVRLSQSLQVQLQRIREADTEVRWQHDEDVSECPTCHVQLPNSKKKVHCRHCGRIYCAACTAHSVPAGPRRAPARVCAVCRTLLQPHTAPYFSTAPPHSPD